jgi:hypothetical protein
MGGESVSPWRRLFFARASSRLALIRTFCSPVRPDPGPPLGAEDASIARFEPEVGLELEPKGWALCRWAPPSVWL